VKGISLFIVPKFMVNADGSLGDRNDVRCVSIEHKLGIHASPTCSLSFGDNGGAIGYLVGEPHRGLQYMFAMMNSARLGVGLQGVGIAEHAGQIATAYAADRKQGGKHGVEGSVAIIEHPDVRRMLGLIKARTQATRALAYRAAASSDFAQRATSDEARAKHQRRVDLMIPIVKGWSTEMGVVAASLGVQVHGGMGYIEETGAAQHYRDARITTIYEGTTGIQALDLMGRKLLRDQGFAMAELVQEMRESAAKLGAASGHGVDWAAQQDMLLDAVDMIEDATQWLLARNDPAEGQAAATALLEMFGICTGAWVMADSALAAAQRLNDGETTDFLKSKLRIAEFYRGQVYPQAKALKQSITKGSDSVVALTNADLGVVA
jgi:3-(methylthio)propanoyl-CoA dehydrogenase